MRGRIGTSCGIASVNFAKSRVSYGAPKGFSHDAMEKAKRQAFVNRTLKAMKNERAQACVEALSELQAARPLKPPARK